MQALRGAFTGSNLRGARFTQLHRFHSTGRQICVPVRLHIGIYYAHAFMYVEAHTCGGNSRARAAQTKKLLLRYARAFAAQSCLVTFT